MIHMAATPTPVELPQISPIEPPSPTTSTTLEQQTTTTETTTTVVPTEATLQETVDALIIKHLAEKGLQLFATRQSRDKNTTEAIIMPVDATNCAMDVGFSRDNSVGRPPKTIIANPLLAGPPVVLTNQENTNDIYSDKVAHLDSNYLDGFTIVPDTPETASDVIDQIGSALTRACSSLDLNN